MNFMNALPFFYRTFCQIDMFRVFNAEISLMQNTKIKTIEDLISIGLG